MTKLPTVCQALSYIVTHIGIDCGFQFMKILLKEYSTVDDF